MSKDVGQIKRSKRSVRKGLKLGQLDTNLVGKHGESSVAMLVVHCFSIKLAYIEWRVKSVSNVIYCDNHAYRFSV